MRTPTGIIVRNVNEALPLALHLVKETGIPVVSRGMQTLEVPGPVFTTYQNPCERVLMDPVRDANPFFHFFESLWILAGANTVQMPRFFLNRITDYSDNQNTFHGAYGHRLRNAHGVDQLLRVVQLLRQKPDTRQAVLSIWKPEYDLGADSKDIPCNDMLMFKVRDERLHLTVCNRSNDIIWGAYGANAVQFSILLEWVAAASGLPVGTYTQMSDSLHVYTDLPLWKAYARGEWRPQGHVTNPYDCDCLIGPLFPDAQEAQWALNDAELLNEYMEAELPNTAVMNPHAFKSFAVRRVGIPMLAAYLNYKHKDLSAAIESAKAIAAPDWSAACVEWLTRRITK